MSVDPTVKPRLFLYALSALGGLSLLYSLWGQTTVLLGLRDGLQTLSLFALGLFLVPVGVREFRSVRGHAGIDRRKRGPLQLLAIATACLGAIALMLGVGSLGRIFNWAIAELLAYGLYGCGAVALALGIVAISSLVWPWQQQ